MMVCPSMLLDSAPATFDRAGPSPASAAVEAPHEDSLIPRSIGVLPALTQLIDSPSAVLRLIASEK